MAQISAALVAEHSTWQGAGEVATAASPGASRRERGLGTPSLTTGLIAPTTQPRRWTHGDAANSGYHHISQCRHLSIRALVPNRSLTKISQNYASKGTHMSVKTIDELLLDELKDLYSAEKQITKALPKMAKAAVSQDLKSAFESHLEETQGHVERLDKIFETLGKSPRGKTCHGMQGLLEEGSEMMGELEKGSVRDAGLISAAQRVEHYEMAGYGSVREFASLLGQKEIASLLDETLEEEKAADEKLTGIAKKVNPQALKANKAA
jgi:ferritin-like metal-binding protein YciE